MANLFDQADTPYKKRPAELYLEYRRCWADPKRSRSNHIIQSHSQFSRIEGQEDPVGDYMAISRSDPDAFGP